MNKNLLTGILLFLFSITLSLYNLTASGRWTDEFFYVSKGHHTIELLKKGLVTHPYFLVEGADHPLTAVYVYGLASYLDLTYIDHAHIVPEVGLYQPHFDYDLFFTRLIAVVVSALSVLLTYIFCLRFFSYFVAVASSSILMTLPHFLGYSQKVSLESWCVLTFSLAVVFCFEYLRSKKLIYAILIGIFSGVTLTVKQSNILIFPFLVLTFSYYKYFLKDKNLSYKSVFVVALTTIITIFITYPMPFLNPQTFWHTTYDAWFVNGGKIPELIFGKMIGAPIVYYFIAISITTPLIILILLLTGGFEIIRTKRKPLYITLLIWFVVPFFMMFFAARQHMVRYIIQVYVPMAIISAIGLKAIAPIFIKDKRFHLLILVPVVVYSMVIIFQTTPYYLTYYNELIGGTKRVYSEKLFLLGWFSEGLKSVSNYIKNNVTPGSRIGYAVNAGFGAVDQIPGYTHLRYDKNLEYDYVVVTVFDVTRGGFDEKTLLPKYKAVYEEKGNGLVVARIYKNRSKVGPDTKLLY